MVESTGLENRRRETVPGFESLPLRHFLQRPSGCHHFSHVTQQPGNRNRQWFTEPISRLRYIAAMLATVRTNG